MAIQILNLNGNIVNILERGKEYTYQYKVVFNKDASAVRAGTILKTVSGLELGGMQSHPVNDAIDQVYSGQSLQFSFNFKCILLPGVYFFNAGVVSKINENEIYLHRIIDALTFRVIHSGPLNRVGIIDIGASMHSSEPFQIVENDD